jgi:hypothetical protein
LKQGWPVPVAVKREAVKRVRQILDDPKGGERSWLAAAKVAVAMTAVTLDSISVAGREYERGELAAEVELLRSRIEEIEGGRP